MCCIKFVLLFCIVVTNVWGQLASSRQEHKFVNVECLTRTEQVKIEHKVYKGTRVYETIDDTEPQMCMVSHPVLAQQKRKRIQGGVGTL